MGSCWRPHSGSKHGYGDEVVSKRNTNGSEVGTNERISRGGTSSSKAVGKDVTWDAEECHVDAEARPNDEQKALAKRWEDVGGQCAGEVRGGGGGGEEVERARCLFYGCPLATVQLRNKKVM
jgi:hypothetical protein